MTRGNKNQSPETHQGTYFHRYLLEADLDLQALKGLGRIIDKKIQLLKSPPVQHRLDLRSDSIPVPAIYDGDKCRPIRHHTHKVIKFDFSCVFVVTYQELRLDHESRVGTWIERAKSEDCFNVNLIDFLIAHKEESFLPKDLKNLDLICAGTIYQDLDGNEWARYAYHDQEKWDWGWVNLNERVGARNYRIAMIKKDDPSRHIPESA